MKRVVLAVIVIGIGMTAGLLWLDLRAMTSATQTEHSISAYGFNVDDKKPDTTGTIAVEVVGMDGDPLVGAVRRALLAEPAVGPASLVPAAEGNDTARLLVDITNCDAAWLPVWSHAVVEPHIVYASDGDLGWKDDTPVTMSSDDGSVSVLRIRGDLTITDESRGIISRPAYRRHLAQQIASSVRAAVAQQLTNR